MVAGTSVEWAPWLILTKSAIFVFKMPDFVKVNFSEPHFRWWYTEETMSRFGSCNEGYRFRRGAPDAGARKVGAPEAIGGTKACCGFAAGRGVGRALARHVLAAAAEDGYRAMQFNAVVETNRSAVRLWESLGFRIIGTVPEAFALPVHGLVGLHIMYRPLTSS
jgi:Acetyltransferase (GNAT) family